MSESSTLEGLTQQLEERRAALQAAARGARRGAALAALLDGAAADLAAAEDELRAQADALFAAQVELDDAARWHRELFESLPTPTLVTTPDGTVTHVNAAATRLLRRPRNGLARRPLSALVHPVDRAVLRAALARLPLGEPPPRHDAADEFALTLCPRDEPARACRVWARAVTLGAEPALVWTIASLLPLD